MGENSNKKFEASALDVMNFFAANNITLALPDKIIVNKTASSAIEDTNLNPYIIANPVENYAGLKNMGELSELIAEIKAFEGCALKKDAINTVIADGNPKANIILIGEAPGATEDSMGIPFCGESGQLLDAMLHSIGLSRKTNVYISNTVFWRPPDNRKPTEEEIAICKPFVERLIALVNPKLIILVGSTAGTSLLGKDFQISKMRRNFVSYNNQYLTNEITVTAIFHPAYLLRQSSNKKTSWYDLLGIKKFIEDNKLL
ncbi:MAG: uracil-DNA glycosylase [Rickettsiaceae bacterium]|nr:uracil-DNA glycosylase [Rickettsiaceae bacterium]